MAKPITYEQIKINDYTVRLYNDKLWNILKYDQNENVVLDVKFKSTKNYTIDKLVFYSGNIKVLEEYYNNGNVRYQGIIKSVDDFNLFIAENFHGESIYYNIDGSVSNTEYYHYDKNVSTEIKSLGSNLETEYHKFQLSLMYGLDFKFVNEFSTDIKMIKDDIGKILKDKEWERNKQKI